MRSFKITMEEREKMGDIRTIRSKEVTKFRLLPLFVDSSGLKTLLDVFFLLHGIMCVCVRMSSPLVVPRTQNMFFFTGYISVVTGDRCFHEISFVAWNKWLWGFINFLKRQKIWEIFNPRKKFLPAKVLPAKVPIRESSYPWKFLSAKVPIRESS